ncbi:MAG: precorrin-3B C(17)-methyltransferase [Pseudomonadota bacterium]
MQKLFIIGTGPGALDLLVPAARSALTQATDWVAYGLYIDLLGELGEGKTRHDKELGEEIDRAKLALELAASGKITALISSGDPGIYAMATVVFEQLASDAADRWSDVEVEVIPGISAMQLAAARVGAPLGHDFCTISLSDLLTPWDVIEQRLNAAAAGDFVVSFYNPVSTRRDWQLNKARDILMSQRGGETPVIIARNLGRDTEDVRVILLAELDAKDVDMLTLVMVGNSETRYNGKWMYTPRGYAGKGV